MAESRPRELQLDEKWDQCVDLTLRRVVYSCLAGGAGGLLLFRSPVSRVAVFAFGAGLGLGSAYTDCSRILDAQLPKWPSPAKGAS